MLRCQDIFSINTSILKPVEVVIRWWNDTTLAWFWDLDGVEDRNVGLVDLVSHMALLPLRLGALYKDSHQWIRTGEGQVLKGWWWLVRMNVAIKITKEKVFHCFLMLCVYKSTTRGYTHINGKKHWRTACSSLKPLAILCYCTCIIKKSKSWTIHFAFLYNTIPSCLTYLLCREYSAAIVKIL